MLNAPQWAWSGNPVSEAVELYPINTVLRQLSTRKARRQRADRAKKQKKVDSTPIYPSSPVKPRFQEKPLSRRWRPAGHHCVRVRRHRPALTILALVAVSPSSTTPPQPGDGVMPRRSALRCQ